jgi:predicted SprT family Zn-dependent metalloprotease
MIAKAPKLSPQTEGTGLVFSQVEANCWKVYKETDQSLIGTVSLGEFTEKGPGAFLVVEQDALGSMAWLAEAIRSVLDYAFDQLKLTRVSIRARVDQFSLLAALEDLGFVEKAKLDSGKKVRLVCDRWDYIQALADSLMLEHLEDRQWSFGFDNGRRRAGLCSYSDKKITVSKYLSLVHDIDDVKQTILHEIAHALSGPKAGHGKKWLATAKKIGYRNETYTGEEIAEAYAPYQGLCPNGHKHYRYQKPKRLYSCNLCGSGFNQKYMIDWAVRSN